MLKLMLQKFPFYSRIPLLMRLHWYSTDGSAEEPGAFWRNVKHHPLHSCVPLWRSFRISVRLHCRTRRQRGGGVGWGVEAGEKSVWTLLLMLTNVLILKSLLWSESPAEHIYIQGKAIKAIFLTPGAANSSFSPPHQWPSCHMTSKEEFLSSRNSWKGPYLFILGLFYLLKRWHFGVLEVRRFDTAGQPDCCDICQWQASLLSGGLGGCWLTL